MTQSIEAKRAAGGARRSFAADAHARGEDVPDTPRRGRIDAIIARCAERHKVSVAEIMARDRRKRVVAARYEAIRIVASVFPQLSTPRLGEIFGGRDHTTILYALGRLG